MSAASSSKRVLRATRLFVLLALSLAVISGCATIIGLDDYTVAGSHGGGAGKGGRGSTGGEAGAISSGGSAGEAGSGEGGDMGLAGQGGEGGDSIPEIVGCDGKTSFEPNANIIKSCLLRAGCDPVFNPVRTVSYCVTFNSQAALPGESCNLTSKSCADYEACEHVGVAHDDLCLGKKTRCEGDLAVNCGNYKGDDRFFDCAALGGTCGTYKYSNDVEYADCKLDITPESCLGFSDDSKFYCHSAAGADDLRYYCWDDEAYGTSCSSLAKCQGDVTMGDASCFFNLQHCTTPKVPTCIDGVANVCSDGDLFKYDCTAVGLDCGITSSTEYCLAPGCTATDVATKCEESCSADGSSLTFCYGGAPYTVKCTDYGFTQCLASTDDDGKAFAACRF